MEDKKPYLYLNAFLAKDEHASLKTADYLKQSSQVNAYDLDSKHELEGKLFVKIPTEKKPKWSGFTENITGASLDELANRSSSAVLIIKTATATMAFTFGYGRFLIDTKYFVHDFGIKTALNTLNHDSLRSVDLFTLEDQAVQKKSQASRESSVGVFGIDISRDVLRAVTGSPKNGVDLKNISGGDAVYSFGIEMDVDEISQLVDLLSGYYANDSYKSNFSWVDNIRKVKEKSEIDQLDAKLIDKIKAKSTEITITIPEIVQWDSIFGFSFTRTKNSIKPTIDPKEYIDNIDIATISVDSIKRDRLFVYDIHENESEHQIYKCIYFEHKETDKTYILFAGLWYEIDNNFVARVDSILGQINVSSLIFPRVYIWEEVKDGKRKSKIESEGDYNERASTSHGYHLLDKKLIKSNRTTTPIELCDLMTNNKQFIHVKHRKGGSAGLSHLFAQGSVSAEILLGDKEFRKKARTVLKRVSSGLQDSVPLNSFKSDGVEVVFLILGEDSASLKSNLPFFSKVNLSKAFENLSQRGFEVSIAGVGTEPKPNA
ncbi:TIGR04141 family sporadically distributed protein [Pseudoalteromonas piscicida]|uniref:TIGR04141 family sporadically distributed protein n=1 Tax=Pseudoalteromonas piscicida TaxID=43662 RepID=UPI001D0BDDD5|nr:TIGR04141 family sporadically distributed protein [Pseudoalteromonas piscicida]UDM61778.1 TIGR04141 family sporadically distributed protein [Pseudoalteromonas piscicida]